MFRLVFDEFDDFVDVYHLEVEHYVDFIQYDHVICPVLYDIFCECEGLFCEFDVFLRRWRLGYESASSEGGELQVGNVFCAVEFAVVEAAFDELYHVDFESASDSA